MVHMSRTSELNELLSAVNDLKKNFGNDLKESEKPSASSQQPLSDGLSRSGVQTSSEESVGAGSSMEESRDRKSTRLNSSHVAISYAVFCLKKKNQINE